MDPLSLNSTSDLRHALFHAMTDGVLVIDQTGLIVDCNPAFHQRLGYDKVELIGRSI
ncbi:MAG: PAS domain-containing protein, partial [Candidatus Thiodiazotropha sp.]